MHNAALASAPQLAQLLRAVIDGEALAYALRCKTRDEAMGLRHRLNKVRSTDRSQVEKMYREAGQPLDSSGGISLFDSLVFRVEGPCVIVQKTGIPASELLGLLEPVPDAATASPQEDIPPIEGYRLAHTVRQQAEVPTRPGLQALDLALELPDDNEGESPLRAEDLL